MMKKTYPPNWPYRQYVGALFVELMKDVEDLKTYWAEMGEEGKFLHFRGTNTKMHTHITDTDVAGWLIAIARKLDRPIHPIVIGIRQPIRKTDHFHIILGIAYADDEHASIAKVLNTSWRDGSSRVMIADLEQEPYSPLEYIPAKHNWSRGKRDVYLPRRLAREWDKKRS